MSKYEKLWTYVKNENKDILELSYEKIEDILGFGIDHSFLTYKKELNEFGFNVKKISMKDKKIFFEKLK